MVLIRAREDCTGRGGVATLVKIHLVKICLIKIEGGNHRGHRGFTGMHRELLADAASALVGF